MNKNQKKKNQINRYKEEGEKERTKRGNLKETKTNKKGKGLLSRFHVESTAHASV